MSVSCSGVKLTDRVAEERLKRVEYTFKRPDTETLEEKVVICVDGEDGAVVVTEPYISLARLLQFSL